MKITRRLAAMLLAVCMLLGLCACSTTAEKIADAYEIVTGALEDLEENQEGFNAAFDEFVDQIGEEEPEPDGQPAPEEESVPDAEPAQDEEPVQDTESKLDPDGVYTSKEDVALYLHLYGELPQNFMTKSEARELGWSGGGLDRYADGMCIGGDRFGNYEGLLPEGSYHECDVDTLHADSRGAKRIIYSDDGRIYYTEDHYESFTLLYGEETP